METQTGDETVTPEEEEFYFRYRLEKERQEQPDWETRIANLSRGSARFVADVAGLPADVGATLINRVAEFGQAIQPQPQPRYITDPFLGSEQIARGMESIGIRTQPTGTLPESQFQYNVGRMGGLLPIRGGPVSAIGAAAGQAISDRPEAGMIGALVPPALKMGAQGVTRMFLRGTDPTALRENIQTLESTGVRPTAGIASQTQTSLGLEGTLQKLPGARGAYAERADQIAKATQQFTDKLASSLAIRRDETLAGRAIQQGIEHWVDNFTARWRGLNDEFLQSVGADTPVQIGNFQRYLTAQTTKHPAAKNILGELQSLKLEGLAAAAQVDALGGALPLDAVIAIRTQIGQKLASSSLIDDVNKGQWKAMYAALSKDIESAAAAKGPRALQEFRRRNKFYEAGLDRINTILAPLAKAQTPEKAFKAALEGSESGATKLWAIRRSLSSQQWGVVQSTIIDRLAKVTKGRQDVTQNLQSIETFLTNYNGLHPRAKAALFGSDTEIRASLDNLAKSASLVKRAGHVLANPSGSAPALIAGGSMFGSLGALSWYLTGQFGIGTALLASPAIGAFGAYGLGKALTNPTFVKWMAKSAQLKPDEIAAHTVRLGIIAERENNPEMKEILSQAYLSERQRLVDTFGTDDPNEFPRALRLAHIPASQ